MQKLLSLINEQKYDEALEGFEEIYKQSNNPIALYYITFIKYYYKDSYDKDEIYDNFKILYNYSKDIRLHIYDFYLSFLMDNEDYENALEVSSKALKECNPNFVYYYSYSRSLAKLSKDLNKATEFANKSVKCEELTELQKTIAYTNLMEIYTLKREFNLAKETINKMYLFSSNIPHIALLELQLSISEGNNKEIEKLTEENLKYEQNTFETYRLLCEYYYETNQFELAIKYHNLIKPFLVSPSFANEKIAICYLYLNKYDEGIKLLKENPLDDEAHTNYLLGEMYYYKGGKDNLKEASNYYTKALEKSHSKENILKSLGDTYFELVDLENLLKTANKLKDLKSNYSYYLEACYYRLSQKFDEAEKLIKAIKKEKIPDFKLNFIIDNCSKNPETLNDYHNEAFSKDDNHSIRNKIKILMFGEYGHNISMEEAKKHVLELEKREDLHTCAYSTIANYYLLVEDYEKAYKYAKEGYDKYLNGEEPCQCCAAFVAYLKLKGLGINQDIEEAYNICKDIEQREYGDVNENVGHVYAECAILLSKDLNRIYELLEKTLFRRYSPSRYFMLVKAGNLLNKDTSKYAKLLKESLKHCSIREKEYYSIEQTDFLLNNY